MADVTQCKPGQVYYYKTQQTIFELIKYIPGSTGWWEVVIINPGSRSSRSGARDSFWMGDIDITLHLHSGSVHDLGILDAEAELYRAKKKEEHKPSAPIVNPIHYNDVPDDLEDLWRKTKNFVRGG